MLKRHIENALHRDYTYSNILEKCQNVILLQKKQLGELDALIKSRFVEMCGNPETNS